MFHKLAFVIAAATLAGTTATVAQLPLPIPLPLPNMEGTPEDRAACEADVKRYCAAYIPNNLQILGCLQDNRKRISRPCQGVLIKYGQ